MAYIDEADIDPQALFCVGYDRYLNALEYAPCSVEVIEVHEYKVRQPSVLINECKGSRTNAEKTAQGSAPITSSQSLDPAELEEWLQYVCTSVPESQLEIIANFLFTVT